MFTLTRSRIFSIFSKNTAALALSVAAILLLSVGCQASAKDQAGQTDYTVDVQYLELKDDSELPPDAIVYDPEEDEFASRIGDSIVKQMQELLAQQNEENQRRQKESEKKLFRAIMNSKRRIGKRVDKIRNEIKQLPTQVKEEVGDNMDIILKRQESLKKSIGEVRDTIQDEPETDCMKCFKLGTALFTLCGLTIMDRMIDTILPTAGLTQYLLVTVMVGGAAITYYVVIDAAGQTDLPFVDINPDHKVCCGFPATRAICSKLSKVLCCCLPCSDNTWGAWWDKFCESTNKCRSAVVRAFTGSSPQPVTSYQRGRARTWSCTCSEGHGPSETTSLLGFSQGGSGSSARSENGIRRRVLQRIINQIDV